MHTMDRICCGWMCVSLATDVELVLEKEAMEADSAVIFTESLHLTK